MDTIVFTQRICIQSSERELNQGQFTSVEMLVFRICQVSFRFALNSMNQPIKDLIESMEC